MTPPDPFPIQEATVIARKWMQRARNLRAAVDTVLDSQSASAVVLWSRQGHGPWDGSWTGDEIEDQKTLNRLEGRKAMKASITFETGLSQDELVNELETSGVMRILASHFGGYPVVSEDTTDGLKERLAAATDKLREWQGSFRKQRDLMDQHLGEAL